MARVHQDEACDHGEQLGQGDGQDRQAGAR
jgi:hypothetical protein